MGREGKEGRRKKRNDGKGKWDARPAFKVTV